MAEQYSFYYFIELLIAFFQIRQKVYPPPKKKKITENENIRFFDFYQIYQQ